MDIEFSHNAEPTLGIEVELNLVHAETGELASAATEILTEIGEGHPEGEHPKAKHELFECTIEIITGVCRTPAEAKADLETTLAEVREAAGRRGLTLVGGGTHPFALAQDQTVSPDPRYLQLVEEMQWPARRLLICGTHYHVAARSGEKAIVIFNELQRYLPLFLILSAASPYLEQDDTGMASVRSKVFEALPTAGLPPPVDDWRDFERFMETLLTANCITSIREVWWDIRPHPDFGTVELRMCDALPTLRESIAIAALAQALVVDIDQRHDAGTLETYPRPWTVRENRWLAGRFGAEAELIVDERGGKRPARELIVELVQRLEPVAARIGSSDELADVLTMLEAGPSYRRQRAIVAGGGSYADVVSSLARELERDHPEDGLGS